MSSVKVALFGATGTMGFEVFKELWTRGEHHLTLLLLPGERAASRFKRYAQEAGIPWQPPTAPEAPVVQSGERLTLVWGDARDPASVKATVTGAELVLNAMAVISPAADYRPELAEQVNDVATGHIIDAIEAEPDGAERIGYVHTASVAQTGNRPLGIHVGRVGDPMNPSIFDSYALTKIRGERRVLESGLKRWVSLRMSFIMPTEHARLMALFDPILFHMPLETRMESVTDVDAGYAMAQCVNVPPESDFWGRVYNLSGGPGMRTDALTYLADAFSLFGLDWEACTERNWYALRNFHLQYYEDSGAAQVHLRHQRSDQESFRAALRASMPLQFRAIGWLARALPGFRALAGRVTRIVFRRLAERHRNSPRYWYLHDVEPRLEAFFGGRAAYEAIPGWGEEPALDGDPEAPWRRLDHGYDEAKATLELADLIAAAAFRGGECLSSGFSGGLSERLEWRCAFGHEFSAKASTVLHAGHWCPTCVESWNGAERARRNPYFAQVWYANFARDEERTYTVKESRDIVGADVAWRTRT